MAAHEITSDDFRSVQARVGWTGKKLADELGVAPDTVSRWRYQAQPIRGPVALAMKALASGWRP